MSKIKYKGLIIGVYQAVITLIMFAYVASIVLTFTWFFEDTLQRLPDILKIAYVIGSVNLIILSLTNNWSLFPYQRSKK